jgi:cation diffusion facilitator CzcD-associated flavoprotein CzcO
MSSADSPGERYEVVVIGAGQAGLATGQFLS